MATPKQHSKKEGLKLTPGGVNQLFGLLIVVISLGAIGYVTWLALQTFTQDTPADTTQSSVQPAASALPTLHLATTHTRQGAVIVPQPTPTDHTDPFIP